MAEYDAFSAPPPNPDDLSECGICGRTFVPETLVRHEKICQKNAAKKRSKFNSAKQRAEGTDINSVPKREVKIPPSKNKNNWRRRHEEFIESMQNARGVSHAIKTGAPLPPPPSQKRVNPDYVQCPTCERHFNQNAAERHIPWCKQQSMRMNKKTPQSADKAKMNARTKYKPPLPGSKKKQSSPNKNLRGTRPARSEVDSTMADIESRMNGGLRIGSKSSVRNKPYPGSKVRSASLERPSPKSSSNSYRSSSGDSVKGRSNSRTRHDSDYRAGDYKSADEWNDDPDNDYDYGNYDSRRNSAGKRLDPLTKNSPSKYSSNHILPHDRLKAMSNESGSPLSSGRTPTPPSSRPSSNYRKTSADSISGRKLPKFCHECGTGYPVPNAKFCCECGTRRTAIY